MKEDINIPEVKNVTIAIVRREIEDQEHIWEVYLMNSNEHQIDNIMIVSHGYGTRDNENVKTSTLRNFFEKLDSHSSMMIEAIDPSLFVLHNEIAITYYFNKEMYFKKFTFVAGSISEEYLRKIPALRLKGVLHS